MPDSHSAYQATSTSGPSGIATSGAISIAAPSARTSPAFAVAAAFFYLRVIVLMYMRDPEEMQAEDRSILPRVAIAVPAVLTLAFGVFPGLIAGIIEKASVLRW